MNPIAPLLRRSTHIANLFALVVVFGVAHAWAQVPQSGQLGIFADWSAFRDTSGPQPVCYIGSLPKKMVGTYNQRGNTYIQVTHRPADKSFDVVSVTAGYAYQPKSQVEVEVDGKDFALFASGGLAWADDKTDVRLVEAMRRGRQLIVRGTSARGTVTTDTYSLAGFTGAYNAIAKACPRK
jgi:invasion protein IalB